MLELSHTCAHVMASRYISSGGGNVPDDENSRTCENTLTSLFTRHGIPARVFSLSGVHCGTNPFGENGTLSRNLYSPPPGQVPSAWLNGSQNPVSSADSDCPPNRMVGHAARIFARVVAL